MSTTIATNSPVATPKNRETQHVPLNPALVQSISNQIINQTEWLDSEINRLAGAGNTVAQIATLLTGSIACDIIAGIQYRILLAVTTAGSQPLPVPHKAPVATVPTVRFDSMPPAARKPQQTNLRLCTTVPAVPAKDIRALLVQIMEENKLAELQLKKHDTIIQQAFTALPELSELPRHERNRKIIDACAGRKRGPVLGNAGSGRYIYIAA